MRIKINKRTYTIKFQSLEEESCAGRAMPKIAEIRLSKDSDKDLLYSVIIHELVHAYLFEYGMPRDNYNQEDMCNFFGAFGTEIIENACKIQSLLSREIKKQN